jgi:hypothetical protein
MRCTNGDIAHMAAVIKDDLEGRGTGLHNPHIKGWADLAASMLGCRSANTTKLLSFCRARPRILTRAVAK